MMTSERWEEESGGGIVWMEEEPKGGVMVKMKRKTRSNRRKEFVGWGSKQVIEFLESIGHDTKVNQFSQYEVTDIIHKYVNDNNLIHPGKGKKKRILCDHKLHSLFGRKSISRIKIYDLLEPHFAENQLDDDDDDGDDSNNDDDNDDIVYTTWDENESIISRKSKKQVSETTTTTTPKLSCFAALISENVKLIYLRRCVVEDILKQEDDDFQSFERKLVGSFVRIKSDPNDYLQYNSHMLLQVTGVKKASGTDDKKTEILLQVANSIKDVHINMLSDDYFSEEELEDLRRRIKDGSLKRPTIAELEQKVQILHRDITKHWIVRELSLLQNLIDKANEKGWRRELFEYLERRHLLQTPFEQSRLLLDVPKVIADEIAPEAPVQNSQDNVDENRSPISILREVLETPAYNFPANGISSTKMSSRSDAAVQNSQDNVDENRSPISILREVSETPAYNLPVNGITSTKISSRADAAVQEKQQQPAEIKSKGVDEARPLNFGNKGFQGMVEKQVIDLSDDEENENLNDRNQIIDDHPGSSIWHYMDPQGDVQGPFSLMSLKCWRDADYFPPGFKVWKIGQSHLEAILLSDLLHLVFRG